MVKRLGLSVVACVVVAVVAAACAPKSNSGDSATIGPTPTPSGTGTATPTPLPGQTTLTPVRSWVTPDGKELWIRFLPNFNGKLVNIATYATACTSSKLALNADLKAGKTTTVFFRNQSPLPNLNCALGAHGYVVDWSDSDGGCATGCVTDTTSFSFAATNQPGSTLTILSNVSATIAYTTDAMRFSATNALGPEVQLTEARVYDAAGNFLTPECPVAATVNSSAEPALFDTCMAVNGYPVSVTGTYKVLFGGKLGDGSEYFQYVPFSFTP